jgi:hypothetical protein
VVCPTLLHFQQANSFTHDGAMIGVFGTSRAFHGPKKIRFMVDHFNPAQMVMGEDDVEEEEGDDGQNLLDASNSFEVI